MSPKIKLSQTSKGILTIIGSCFFNLVLGSMYMWGNINLYVTSYYKNVSSDEASIIFPFTGFIGNFGIILGFPLVRIFGFRLMVFMSTLLIFGFLFACAFCGSFWNFFLCFAIGFGLTTGLLYLTLMYNTFKYFPHRRGLVGGILMGVYGVSGLIANYIFLLVMNPNNDSALKNDNSKEYYFPDEIANRLPLALRTLGFYFLGVMLIGNLLQFEFKDTIIEVQQGEAIKEEILMEIDESSMINENNLK